MVKLRSRKKTQFKKGHKGYPTRGCTPVDNSLNDEMKKREYVRLTRDVQDMLDTVGATYANTASDADERHTPMVLRPRPARPAMLETAQTPATHDAEMETNRLFHPKKTAELFNEAIREHAATHPGCKGNLKFHQAGEVQRGFCWREQLKCDICQYISQRRKLYEEVKSSKRGPKTATANVGAQVGASHTGVANAGLSRIFVAMNTPAPSLSSMQSTANRVNKSIVKTNDNDMATIRRDIKEVQAACGQDKLNIEVDCRYSNPTHASTGNTPFQAATQMTQLVAENLTTSKKIIGKNFKSQLCVQCAASKNRNEVIKPHDCSSNLDTAESIGNERLWTRESVESLEEDGLHINILTTDPDASAFKGAEDAYFAGVSSSPPKHQLDTRHVSSNHRKHIKNTNFSKAMFGARTEAEKKYSQTRFSSDLSTRCSAEHKAAMDYYGGDASRVSKRMPSIRNNLLKCYSGCHSECGRKSFVCRGRANNNWITQSSYLKKSFKLHSLTDADKEKLSECIEYRLGHNMLNKTKYLLSTQKCEAVNKAISATVPRHLTFTRNHDGRNSAAIHAVNSGIGTAIITECHDAGAPLTAGTRVTRRLLKMQKEAEKMKDFKKSPEAKRRRYLKRKRLFSLHSEKLDSKQDKYVKNASLNTDHTYSKV